MTNILKDFLYYLRIKLSLYSRLILSKRNSRKGDAFLIVGASRTGTKMLTRFFINGGCAGNGEGRQLYEYCNPDVRIKKAVWKTNLPYKSDKKGNVDIIFGVLKRIGYNIKVLYITRDEQATLESQIKQGTPKEKAIKNIAFAKKYLNYFIKDKDFIKVNYEEFVKSKAYRKRLANNCNIKHRELEKYINQNKLHNDIVR